MSSTRSPRTVGEAFSQAVPEYDTWVRQALPTYDELFTVAVETIPWPSDRPLQVADLGAGTGLFAGHVLAAYPNAQFFLVDVSQEMLDVARQRFAGRIEQFTCVQQDLADFSAASRFDLVISSLAIHHLEHGAKRSLFQRIFAALRPGGVFINVDQVKGIPPFDEIYWATWLKRVHQTDADEAHIRSSIERRQQFDRDARLVDQLDWLSEAGFDADCLYKHYFIAVFLALKPETTAGAKA